MFILYGIKNQRHHLIDTLPIIKQFLRNFQTKYLKQII